ncbi:MAG TPA: Trp biosynthesis-associated membrane protein [Candidatus Limnocylindrales bacterium]|nr:Trp biosynthesis-associated membrane protein [Candidatus Limnocylindrales bacterium]
MINHRSRIIALLMILAGAGLVWFNAAENLRNGTRALSLAALAAGGALLATKGRARRLIAFAVVVAGVGLTLGGNSMAILSGVFVTIGGGLAFVTCPTWPVMGVRFERAPVADDLDLWAALDRGEDPTSPKNTPRP